MSEDTGKTWKMQSQLPLLVSTDLRFIDENSGIICGGGKYVWPGQEGAAAEIYTTSDRGVTWKKILGDHPEIFGDEVLSVGYLGSTSKILAATVGGIMLSTDAGNTWGTLSNKDFPIYISSTEYSKDSYYNIGSSLFYSFDNGISWKENNANLPVDTWTFATDSCNSDILYFANEDYAIPENGLSEILVSTDKGQSVRSTFSRPMGRWITGTIATSQHAIFFTTWLQGVFRSTDKGNTWDSIGGPCYDLPEPSSMSPDVRTLAVISDDIVVVADLQDNIWITTNSGGDSLKHLFSHPDTLFTNEILSRCDSPITRSIKLPRDDCNMLTFANPTIIGSKNYSIASVNDSVQILFSPTDLSDTSEGLLLITSSNGKTDTIRLVGKTEAAKNILICSTADQVTDTIGGTVRVPLSIQKFAGSKDMEVVLHYDNTTDLVYQGSFSLTGIRLDIQGEQWPGRSKLKLPAAKSNEKLAEATFAVFADSSRRPKVWFDSLNVPSATSPCEYSLAPIAVSTITPPQGCGTSRLSKFMHGETPNIIIRPNPATNIISIESSVNLGNCQLSFFDQLGKQCLETTKNLSKDDPMNIDVSMLVSGIYMVRIESDGLTNSQTLVIAK